MRCHPSSRLQVRHDSAAVSAHTDRGARSGCRRNRDPSSALLLRGPAATHGSLPEAHSMGLQVHPGRMLRSCWGHHRHCHLARRGWPYGNRQLRRRPRPRLLGVRDIDRRRPITRPIGRQERRLFRRRRRVARRPGGAGNGALGGEAWVGRRPRAPAATASAARRAARSRGTQPGRRRVRLPRRSQPWRGHERRRLAGNVRRHAACLGSASECMGRRQVCWGLAAGCRTLPCGRGRPPRDPRQARPRHTTRLLLWRGHGLVREAHALRRRLPHDPGARALWPPGCSILRRTVLIKAARRPPGRRARRRNIARLATGRCGAGGVRLWGTRMLQLLQGARLCVRREGPGLGEAADDKRNRQPGQQPPEQAEFARANPPWLGATGQRLHLYRAAQGLYASNLQRRIVHEHGLGTIQASLPHQAGDDLAFRGAALGAIRGREIAQVLDRRQVRRQGAIVLGGLHGPRSRYDL
mmetsp:Transcript_110730/g.319897  ORF Transcript_110730/g.319897 Transcript_110730/m.319897 type:complete len:468 (+) Transcript_110730:359-1762(+)